MGAENKLPCTPYRTAPEQPPARSDGESAAAGAFLLVALILGLLIFQFAPRNRSGDPEPRGRAAHHGGGHASVGGGHR